jgi:hypothetical protein
MAKQDSTTYYIIGGLVLAVGGVYGFRAYEKNRRKKLAAAEAEAQRARAAEEAKTIQQKNIPTTPAYSPYQLQVIALQTKLGIGVDGNPGTNANSQTNTAVRNAYPKSYATYGNVSPANVLVYVKAKKETAQAATETKTAPAQSSKRVDEIWNAMGDGKPAVTRLEKSYPAYYYDSSKGSYQPTTGIFKVKAGTKLYKSTSKKTGSGFIASLNVTDAKGKPYSNKMVLVGPENLYVP